MKVTNLTTSPKSFQDLRGKLIEATEDELVICQFTSAAIFIGKTADESKVVHLDYCDVAKLPIIRTQSPHSSSGYHDANQFRTLGVITKASNFPFLTRPWSRGPTTAQGGRVLAGIMESALDAVGIKAKCRGNDILLDDKKIGHFGAPKYPDVIMLSAHILLDWDIAKAEQAIISPKHDMREYVRGLKELGYDISFDQMRDAFVTEWEKVF